MVYFGSKTEFELIPTKQFRLPTKAHASAGSDCNHCKYKVFVQSLISSIWNGRK